MVSLALALTRPVTVALSAIDAPTVALAGCWLVLMVGLVGGMVTGSALVALVAGVASHPVVRARSRRGVPLRSGHAAYQWLVGIRVERTAGGIGIVVKVERHRPGGIVTTRDRGLVSD